MAGLAVVAAAMSEDQLEHAIRRMFKDLGLTKFTFHPRGRGGFQEGYPDWTILGPRGLLFRELKREGKKPTVAQKAWLDRFRALGYDADVWYPTDLLSGRIARELAAISGFAGKAG